MEFLNTAAAATEGGKWEQVERRKEGRGAWIEAARMGVDGRKTARNA